MKKLALVLSCLVWPAMAQEVSKPPCLVVDQAVQYFAEKGFQYIFHGVSGDETLSIWVSQEKGWHLTVLRPDGMLCLLVSGGQWQWQAPGEPA